jgi:hypothetical protein
VSACTDYVVESWEGRAYLGFKLLEFLFLLFLVLVDFALGFCSGFFYALCAVCTKSAPRIREKGVGVFVSSVIRGEDVHSLAINPFQSVGHSNE